jgi:kynurenine formamidase
VVEVGVDTVGVDTVGVDTVGVDTVGVDTVGVDAVAVVDDGACGRDSDCTGVLAVEAIAADLELVPDRDPVSVIVAFDPEAALSID